MPSTSKREGLFLGGVGHFGRHRALYRVNGRCGGNRRGGAKKTSGSWRDQFAFTNAGPYGPNSLLEAAVGNSCLILGEPFSNPKPVLSSESFGSTDDHVRKQVVPFFAGPGAQICWEWLVGGGGGGDAHLTAGGWQRDCSIS